MSEETQNQEVNEVVQNAEGNTEQQTQEINPAEAEARKSGWVPKEEFVGDEYKWVDAGEFLRRGELFEKIEKQNRKLKETEKALQLLAQHNNRIAANAYNDALATLKAQKKEALIEGDADAVINIDERMDEVREQKRDFDAKAAQAAAAAVHTNDDSDLKPEFIDWVNRNQWYNNDIRLASFADSLGNQLARKGMSPNDVLKEVEKAVREEFPHKFRNANKDKASPVEGTNAKSTNSTGGYKPTPEEKRIAQRFAATGVMTEQEYYKQLQGTKE